MLIGELAQRTGVAPRLLRYYGEQGLLASERNTSGYRVYDEEAVVRVCQIRKLLAAGLTTEMIAGMLDCASGPAAHLDLCPELVRRLRGELAEVDRRIGDLAQRREVLSGYLGQA
ncbi:MULTISPECIES: MerR family transcriptional regulator [Amycolatopsis]|uniref:MerR family transcriptional regulator n=1 Tax=Amycolatopsis TaxID=1813 RepID=UPI000399B6E6|nr:MULTISPECIES: MerR family transcriptional regulator [Amycolatopsis]MCG3751346.1 MerR family transcriptional regulator [Amycolatopsis sp. Poz14]